jgi:PST family polysaccharide transporter
MLSSVNKNPKLKRLMDNFLSLTIVQAVNNLIPLLVFPYLVHVLGIDGFGLFSFIMAVIGYGVIFTGYGFDLSATKLISIHRDDKIKLNEIYSSVLSIKILLSIFYFLLVSLLVFSVDKFSNDWLFYLLAYGTIFGQVIFPLWFFLGVEQMRYITIINTLTKLVFTGSIFIFVNSIDDMYMVFILNSLGFMSAGIIALYIVKRDFGISFKFQSYETLKYYFLDGWYIFVSRIAVELFKTFNIIILGFFVGNTILGYYAIATKILQAIGSVLSPITNTLYPYLAALHQKSIKVFYDKNILLSLAVLAIMIPFAILVFIFREELLHLITGDTPNMQVIYLLSVLLLTIPNLVLANQFTNVLVILDEAKTMNNIVLFAGLLNLIIAPIIIKVYGVEGLVWLNVVISYYVVLTKGYFVFFKYKNKYLIKNGVII